MGLKKLPFAKERSVLALRSHRSRRRARALSCEWRRQMQKRSSMFPARRSPALSHLNGGEESNYGFVSNVKNDLATACLNPPCFLLFHWKPMSEDFTPLFQAAKDISPLPRSQCQDLALIGLSTPNINLSGLLNERCSLWV